MPDVSRNCRTPPVPVARGTPVGCDMHGATLCAQRQHHASAARPFQEARVPLQAGSRERRAAQRPRRPGAAGRPMTSSSRSPPGSTCREGARSRIARELGLDPSTVSRYLKRARTEGIVRIAITRPSRERTDLARQLAQVHGLARAIVVEADDDALVRVCAATAEHVEQHLVMGMHLGLSWGRTVAGVVHRLRPGSVAGLVVAQLAGGVDAAAPDIQGHDIVRAAVVAYPGSQPRYLYAPAVVETERLASALIRERSIRRTFDAAERCQLAIVGIGGMERAATLVTGGHITQEDHERLTAAGAVGSLNTRFFDREGRPAGDLDGRTIALPWEQLDAIPMVVAAAAGADKETPVAAALRTGVVDVLVVDDRLAQRLLAHRRSHAGRDRVGT